MSAFPESGHSDRQNLNEIRGRLRPQADDPLFAAAQSETISSLQVPSAVVTITINTIYCVVTEKNHNILGFL